MSEENVKEKIGQLLRGTNLTAREIADQLKIPKRFVYRHPAWNEVKRQRKQQEKGTVREPELETSKIEFEAIETPPPPPTPGGGPLETPEEPEPEPTPTLPPSPPPVTLKHGTLEGILDAGFEVLCDTTKLTKPNPVKIQKLDHALVDFMIAWNVSFADPRIWASFLLVATGAEIALPMVKEYRTQHPAVPGEKAPKTTEEKALKETQPLEITKPNPIVEKRIKDALGATE